MVKEDEGRLDMGLGGCGVLELRWEIFPISKRLAITNPLPYLVNIGYSGLHNNIVI